MWRLKYGLDSCHHFHFSGIQLITKVWARPVKALWSVKEGRCVPLKLPNLKVILTSRLWLPCVNGMTLPRTRLFPFILMPFTKIFAESFYNKFYTGNHTKYVTTNMPCRHHVRVVFHDSPFFTWIFHVVSQYVITCMHEEIIGLHLAVGTLIHTVE